MTRKGHHGENHIDPIQKRLEDDAHALSDKIKKMQETASTMRGPMAYTLTCSVDTTEELWGKREELRKKLAMLEELFPDSAVPDDDEMQELSGAAKIF